MSTEQDPHKGHNIAHKGVSINPLPQVHIYNAEEYGIHDNRYFTQNIPTPSAIKPEHKPPNQVVSRSFTFIYANINSWSPHAQNRLLNDKVKAEILFLVETHQISNLQIKADLRQNGRRAFLNRAEPSAKSMSGTHGGECIAPLTHLDIKPVPTILLVLIMEVTGAPLRCTFAIMQLRKSPILVGTVYFWDSEELSDRNVNILRQIYI